MTTTTDQNKAEGRVAHQRMARRGDALHKIEHKSPGMACNNFKPYTEVREVRIMAVAEGYAMVRRKGAMPYVSPLNELHPPSDQAHRSARDNL